MWSLMEWGFPSYFLHGVYKPDKCWACLSKPWWWVSEMTLPNKHLCGDCFTQTHSSNETLTACFPRYLSALFPLMSMGIRCLREDRILPFCSFGRRKKDRNDLAMMTSKLLPVHCICETTEGLPEALLCGRADLWLLLPSQIEIMRHMEEL